jgi:hypothetical protein
VRRWQIGTYESLFGDILSGSTLISIRSSLSGSCAFSTAETELSTGGNIALWKDEEQGERGTGEDKCVPSEFGNDKTRRRYMKVFYP